MKPKSKQKTVWKFTNQCELTKSEFIDYFERKIFRTIRKYNMLPKDKITKLKKHNTLHRNVLKHVLEKKFKTKFSQKPNLSSENLSQVAEQIFSNIFKGNFKSTGLKPQDKPFKPLYFLSDAEIELYAKLTKIKGRKRLKDKNIQNLFERFMKKNPDLEHNVVNAGGQILL